MNRYDEMSARHQKTVNELPIRFAFNQKQLDEIMVEFGLNPAETYKLAYLGNGGFYLRSDEKLIMETFKRLTKEFKAEIKADETGTGFIYDMFLTELRNHEYIVTRDFSDALSALRLKYEDVEKDKRLTKGLMMACRTIEKEDSF